MPYTDISKKFFFNRDGSLRKNNWVSVGGKLYYCDSNGRIVTGWQKINGKRFYFDRKGVRIT